MPAVLFSLLAVLSTAAGGLFGLRFMDRLNLILAFTAGGVVGGVGFQASPRTGLLVATAVVAHDFADGLNTVSLMHLHKNPRPRTVALLAVDALAPLAGAASTLALHLPGPAVALYLGFFAGFLL